MPLITDSEMDDFEAAIVAAGFDVHDFNVVPLEDDEPTAIEQYVPTGTVTVRRISTGEFIIYKASSGSIWWQAFEADLHAGQFGEP